MAAMTTALTEFSTIGNSRTFTTAGHSASKPKLVVQKRKVAENGSPIAESTISVIHATVDSDGAVLPQKVSMSVTVRYPIDGQSTDIEAVQTILSDIVASDEFDGTINTQNFLK